MSANLNVLDQSSLRQSQIYCLTLSEVALHPERAASWMRFPSQSGGQWQKGFCRRKVKDTIPAAKDEEASLGRRAAVECQGDNDDVESN